LRRIQEKFNDVIGDAGFPQVVQFFLDQIEWFAMLLILVTINSSEYPPWDILTTSSTVRVPPLALAIQSQR
jgi:hypothetical protein